MIVSSYYYPKDHFCFIIDGKTLRRSFDKSLNKACIHIVSAWSSKNNMVLGQIKINEKSNEITAIPELLKLLDINGCIVTIDAMLSKANHYAKLESKIWKNTNKLLIQLCILYFVNAQSPFVFG